MSVRFMPDGRLKTERGVMLDAGPDLESDDAARLIGSGLRVLFHSYPDTTEITTDRARIAALIRLVEVAPDFDGHSARLYRSGDERILVIDHFH